MSNVSKPTTQKAMVEQLWFAIVGSNGEGIASVTRRNERHIFEIKEQLPQLLPRDEYEEAQQKRADADEAWKRYREQKRMNRITLVVAGVTVPLLAAGLSIIWRG